jgi:uncharacterized protein
MDKMTDNMQITDETIRKTLAAGKKYFIVVYKAGPDDHFSKEEGDKIQWEHLRYIFGLRAEGKLLVNGPVIGNVNLSAIGIFSAADMDQVRGWMADDPNIKSGRRGYDLYEYFGIPGDTIT